MDGFLGVSVEGIFITWRELLIGLILLALLYLCQMLFLFIRRRNAPTAAFPNHDNQDVSRLSKELAAIRMRMDAIESHLESSSLPVPQAPGPQEAYDAEFAQSPHGQAMLLARDGLDANELARRCGISVSEASLIVAMAKNRAG